MLSYIISVSSLRISANPFSCISMVSNSNLIIGAQIYYVGMGRLMVAVENRLIL